MLNTGRTYVNLKSDMAEFIELARCVLYPKIFAKSTDEFCTRSTACRARALLTDMLGCVYDSIAECQSTVNRLFLKFSDIRALLETDIQAAYEGDPAARSKEEIMLAYPAFEAISTFRMAHELYLMGVPLLPRMMTEYAHSLTGIDIHPGATIGSHFFIDHGTGVVIGETTVIGEHVKLYQGVTLGARSFEVGQNGELIKGNKRHPNIGNNVVIYAGATILGGNVYIGDNCVIGGNVWLTQSVEAVKTVVAAHAQINVG